MTTKKELLQHFRRADISFARRLRLLDEHTIKNMFGGDVQKKPINSTILPLSLIDEIEQFRENYTYLSPILQSADVEEKIKPNAIDAYALLDTQLAGLNSNEDLEHIHYQSLAKGPRKDLRPINILFTLTQKLENLSPPSDDYLTTSQDYFKRCLECIKGVNQHLHTVKNNFAKKLPIKHFEHHGCSIFCAQESLGENFDCEIARSLFSLPKETPVLIVSDVMKDGVVRVFDSSSLSEENLSSLPFNVSLKENGLFFHDLASPPNLSSIYKTNQENTLNKIGEHCSKSILNDTSANRRTQLHPADLSLFKGAFNTLGGLSPKKNSLSLELSPNQTWFIFDEGKIKRTLLKDIPASTRTIFNSESKDTGIQIPYSIIKRLKSPENFDISLSNTNEWIVDKKTPISASITEFPRIDKKIKAAAKKHLKKQSTPGYVDHQYTIDDLKKNLTEQALSTNWLNKSLMEFNSSTNTEAVLDIDIRSTSGENSRPYFINITVLSAQKNSPYVRNVSCCIDHGDGNLTEKQLLELGMSQEQFNESSLPLNKAQNHLLKPFNQLRSKGAIFLHNTHLSLPMMTETLPLITKKIQTWPVFDKQKLIKENGLASRKENVITINAEKNKAKPFNFRDSAGAGHSLKEKIKQGEGDALSICGGASLKIRDKNVYLLDLKNNTATKLGASKDFLYKLHSQTRPMGSNQIPGSLSELYSHHTVMRMLQGATPQKSLNIPPMVDIPNILFEHKDSDDIEALKADYFKIIKDIPGYFTVHEMLNEVERYLTLNGKNPNEIISGGVGGKKGIEFLTSLKEKSPELFAATTYGKNINLDRLLSGSQSLRITKEQASLTYKDYLLANILSLHKNNHEVISHFQLADIAPVVFKRLEPTTSLPPAESINALSKYTGTNRDGISDLYTIAYQFKQYQNQSYQSFLNNEEKWLPFGDGGLTSMVSIFGALQIKDSLSSNWLNKLEQHNQQIKIEQVASLSLPEYKNSYSDQLLDDAKKVITTPSKMLLPDELKVRLSEAIKLMKLSNGAHNIITKSNNTIPPAVVSDNYKSFSHLIYNQDSVESINNLNTDLIDLGIKNLNLLPSKVEAKQFVISIIRAAIDDTVPVDFNSDFTIKQLSEIETNLLNNIGLLGLNHSNINNRISKIIDKSKIEFTCVNIVDELFRKNNYVVTDDKVASKRHFEEQYTLSGSQYTPATYQEIANIVLKQNSLPKETENSLYIASQNGFSELPKEYLANQIFKRIRYNARCIQSPFPINEGPLSHLQGQFRTASNNPLDQSLSLALLSIAKKTYDDSIKIKPEKNTGIRINKTQFI